MKILTIFGGPRRKGNTATILSVFEQMAGREHAIERVDVVAHNIKGCLGCDHCQRYPDSPACVQKDDMPLLLEKLMAADLVVYASPVYVWDFPAQMKAVMDRHYCLVKWQDGVDHSLLAGKPVMLLVTCGGEAETNTDLIRQVFQREMDYLHCRNLGEFVAPNCTQPSELGEITGQVAGQMTATLAALQ
jgi:multimeric flavodoxin WrbA